MQILYEMCATMCKLMVGRGDGRARRGSGGRGSGAPEVGQVKKMICVLMLRVGGGGRGMTVG